MEGGDAAVKVREDLRTDMVLAAGTGALAVFGTWVELTYSQIAVPPGAGGYALAIAAAAVLVFRRRAPVRVAIAALVLVYAYHLLGYPGEAPGVVLFVAFYSVTAHGSGLRAIATGLGLTVAAEFISVVPPNPVPWYSPAVLAPAVSIGAGVLSGAVVRQRRMALEARTVQEATAAEGRLRERMAAERLLIARDLHDILAHTLSVIAVQAGVALDALDDDPAQARKSITAVRAAARDVLPGLHETLRTLRGEAGGDGAGGGVAAVDMTLGGAASDSRAPQPGLGRLEAVAEKARASGLSVELLLPQAQAGVSPLLELTVYWIVTEALSNVMKHSNASHVSAAVTVDRELLHIRVEDDGRPKDASSAHAPGQPRSTGFGLRGMQERAQLAGGTVEAGTTPAGGFLVSARLPLGAP